MNTLTSGLTENSSWRLQSPRHEHTHRHEHAHRRGRGVEDAGTSPDGADSQASTTALQTAAPAKPASSVFAALQSVTDAVMKIAERFLSGNQTLSVAPATPGDTSSPASGTSGETSTDAAAATTPPAEGAAAPAATGGTLSAESESLKLKIKGVIRTEDGTLVKFKVSLNIRRDAVQFDPAQAAANGQEVDGVQVNSDQPAASFSSTRIQFDLKARVIFGQSAPVNAGSGELAVGDAAQDALAADATPATGAGDAPATTPTEPAQTPASTSYPELMFFRLRLSMTQSALQISWPATTASPAQLPAGTPQPTASPTTPASDAVLAA